MFNQVNYDIAQEIISFLEPLFLHASSNEDVAQSQKILISIRDQLGSYVHPSQRMKLSSDDSARY